MATRKTEAAKPPRAVADVSRRDELPPLASPPKGVHKVSAKRIREAVRKVAAEYKKSAEYQQSLGKT